MALAHALCSGVPYQGSVCFGGGGASEVSSWATRGCSIAMRAIVHRYGNWVLEFRLSNGRHVNRLSDGTYQIVETDEIIREV